MTEPLLGEGFRLRRATADDVEFMADLAVVSVREPEVGLIRAQLGPRAPSGARRILPAGGRGILCQGPRAVGSTLTAWS